MSVLCLALVHAPAAHAVDGCTVLLCLAGPAWRSIAECVPPVTQVMRDLARGRPFPTCDMGGPGNTSYHQWSSAPSYCPPQYTRQLDGPNGPRYFCDYVGAISVDIGGQPWSRTWWQFDGSSVTEYLPAAKAQLTTWDTRFDDDYARWLATQSLPRNPM